MKSDQWGFNVSEDCLYLNVIRPANYSSYDQPLPIGVWIYVRFWISNIICALLGTFLRVAVSLKADHRTSDTIFLSSYRTA